MRSTRSFALFASVLCLPLLSACDESEETKVVDRHDVFFVGYVYDGARGVRLPKASVKSVVLKYRDKTIETDIEADGRFVTKTALPTWQDYSVSITADGYRPFVSRNLGIDVPASLSMTDGLAGAATTQTFHYDAYLFPVGLKTPKLTINLEQADELASTTGMPTPRASGSIRFRPESTSLLEAQTTSAGTGAPTSPRNVRRWNNDEDLLNQTISKAFTDGRVELAEGELVYGVIYQIAVFDVRGYQPTVLSGQQGIVAGSITSRSIILQRELREPLRLLSTTAASCTPPAGAATTFGAEVKLVFNEAIEAVGTTLAEDIDNGVSITPVGYSSTGTGNYCALKENRDPMAQERGTRVIIEGNTMTLAFNPSVGINATSFGCMVPAALTSVVYGNLQSISLRPMGDTNPARRRSLGTMVAEHQQTQGPIGGGGLTGNISCPSRL